MAVNTYLVQSSNIPEFLSRLCGGEYKAQAGIFKAMFLSRLCGGECAGGIVCIEHGFLSRLCGGE